MEQAPAGFLPRVYYGLTRGDQTYRFTADAEFAVNIDGTVGTAYELYSTQELTNEYIPAIATKIDENTLKIVVKGDYTVDTATFKAINMTTGADTSITLTTPLSLQNASALLDYPAVDNKNKQITVINSLESNAYNVIYVSLDYNSDNIYNWIAVGSYKNGTNGADGEDGTNTYVVNVSNIRVILPLVRPNKDIILVGGDTFGVVNNSHIVTTFYTGDLITLNVATDAGSITPENLNILGNIRGPRGLQGDNGANGYTPYIQNGYWYINGVNTNVKAIGTDGTDGQNGQSFQMQSGLYSTPDNWGENNNVDPDGNPLLQLPTLPQTNITGKGYVVYDPLTTPLAPYYDLYYANNGDNDWTIIHPFSGIAGTNGTNGSTPYIQNNNWYIDGVNTGVAATGPQGPAGPGVPSGGTAGQVLAKVDGTNYNTEWITPSAGGGSLYLHSLNIRTTGFQIIVYVINNNSMAFILQTFAQYLIDRGYTTADNSYNRFPFYIKLNTSDPIFNAKDIAIYASNTNSINVYGSLSAPNLTIDFANETFNFGISSSTLNKSLDILSDNVTPL